MSSTRVTRIERDEAASAWESTAAAAASFRPGFRLGVEEEFLVIDPQSRAVVPRAGAVLQRARHRLGDRVTGEITELQVELRTTPCETAVELLEQLRRGRRLLHSAAVAEGLRVVASGTPVLGDVVPPPIIPGERPARGMATFRALHDEASICAVHVHVELPDRDRAVLVGNHLRPYLPILLALTANSPYWDGRDSGYASWRTIGWQRWPVAGPPPYLTSAAHYDRTVATLQAAGAIVDAGTIFWDVRPSARLPTLEVRVADVPVTAEESAVYAALVRALVVTLDAAVAAGDPGPQPAPELLRAAYWRAARDGLAGYGVNPHTGALIAVEDLVSQLVDTVRPTLRAYGELNLVTAGLDRLVTEGTGAVRQRRAAQAGGRLADVVDDLIARTVPTS
jgi:carboxylate-amine ligase